MHELRIAALLAATMTMGIAAGVYQLYAFAIMPGLSETDDRTFVGAFQQIDTAIVGPFLLVFFLGALVFTALAAALHLGERKGVRRRSVMPWIVGALVLQLVVVVVTVVVNVPLNDEIKAAGGPGEVTDLAAVREQFNEARWVGWNLVRVLASTIAFGSLGWALVLRGRQWSVAAVVAS